MRSSGELAGGLGVRASSAPWTLQAGAGLALYGSRAGTNCAGHRRRPLHPVSHLHGRSLNSRNTRGPHTRKSHPNFFKSDFVGGVLVYSLKRYSLCRVLGVVG